MDDMFRSQIIKWFNEYTNFSPLDYSQLVHWISCKCDYHHQRQLIIKAISLTDAAIFVTNEWSNGFSIMFPIGYISGRWRSQFIVLVFRRNTDFLVRGNKTYKLCFIDLTPPDLSMNSMDKKTRRLIHSASLKLVLFDVLPCHLTLHWAWFLTFCARYYRYLSVIRRTNHICSITPS